MGRLIQAVQRRVAEVAIGASTVRGQGAKGVAAAARQVLAGVPLRAFAAADPAAFRSVLDDATIRLMRALPEAARSWGLARKCLNVFLRDALYNVYLAAEFGLAT